MAVHDSNSTKPGCDENDWRNLLDSEYCWGRIYRGSREQLLAAGIVKENQLPGEPGVNAKTQLQTQTPDGHRLKIRRQHKRFEVWWRFSEDDIRIRENKERLDKALQQEKRLLSTMPCSHEQYRKKISLFVVEEMFKIRFRLLEHGCGGYCYAPEVLQQFDEAVAEIKVTLDEGRTFFNERHRRADIAEIRALTAKADLGLQGFINQIQTEPLGAA